MAESTNFLKAATPIQFLPAVFGAGSALGALSVLRGGVTCVVLAALVGVSSLLWANTMTEIGFVLCLRLGVVLPTFATGIAVTTSIANGASLVNAAIYVLLAVCGHLYSTNQHQKGPVGRPPEFTQGQPNLHTFTLRLGTLSDNEVSVLVFASLSGLAVVAQLGFHDVAGVLAGVCCGIGGSVLIGDTLTSMVAPTGADNVANLMLLRSRCCFVTLLAGLVWLAAIAPFGSQKVLILLAAVAFTPPLSSRRSKWWNIACSSSLAIGLLLIAVGAR